MTIRKQAEEILTAAHWFRDPQDPGCRMARWIKRGTDRRVYLGTRGAIRTGKTKAESYPISLDGLRKLVAAPAAAVNSGE